MADDAVAGPAPLAIVMISLNEAHNMRPVLENIRGLASEIFVVDSFSSDRTVEIAREYGAHVVQNAFTGFGDQWNFALRELPITAPWTMKLDPDERFTPQLAAHLRAALAADDYDGFTVERRLWFMGSPLPVRDRPMRLWRTGRCRFSDVLVNEHALVDGRIGHLAGHLEHHDSPDLHHWFNKQNRYSTAEAQTAYEGRQLSAEPRLFGSPLQRRMWFKRVYFWMPFRHVAMFFYCFFWLGAWRAGRAGLVWSRCRVLVFRMREDKIAEMRKLGRSYDGRYSADGTEG